MEKMDFETKTRRGGALAILGMLSLFNFGFFERYYTEENKQKYAEETGNFRIDKTTFVGQKKIKKETIHSNKDMDSQIYVSENITDQVELSETIPDINNLVYEKRYYLKDASKETLEEIMVLLENGEEIPSDQIEKVNQVLSSDELDIINNKSNDVKIVYIDSNYHNPYDWEEIPKLLWRGFAVLSSGLCAIFIIPTKKQWDEIKEWPYKKDKTKVKTK